MPRKFSELRDRMSPESRRKSQERTAEMLKELDELVATAEASAREAGLAPSDIVRAVEDVRRVTLEEP
jgi:hypothetical protein